MNSMTYMLCMQISLGLWLCCTTGVFSKEDKSRRKVIDNLLKNPSKDAAGIDEVENEWINKEVRTREIEDKRLQKNLESRDNDVPDIWERIQNVFGGKYYVIAIIGIVAFLAVSCTLHALLIKLLIDRYRDSEDKNAKNKKKLTRQEKRQLSSIFPRGTTKKNKVQESTVPLLSHSSPMTRSPKQSSDRQARHMRPQGQKMPPKKVLSSPLSSGSPKKEINQNQMRLYDDHITTRKKSKEYNSSKVNKNKNFSNVQLSYSFRKTDTSSSDVPKKKNHSKNNLIFSVNTTEQAIPQNFQNSQRGTNFFNQGHRHDSNTKTSKKSDQHTSCHRSSISPMLLQNTNTFSSDPLLYVTANEETAPNGILYSQTPTVKHCAIPFKAQSPKLRESSIQNACSVKHSIENSVSKSESFVLGKEKQIINENKTEPPLIPGRQAEERDLIGDEGEDSERSKIPKIKAIPIRQISSPQRYNLSRKVKVDKQLPLVSSYPPLLTLDQHRKREPLLLLENNTQKYANPKTGTCRISSSPYKNPNEEFGKDMLHTQEHKTSIITGNLESKSNSKDIHERFRQRTNIKPVEQRVIASPMLNVETDLTENIKSPLVKRMNLRKLP